jgi:hypothetical protein
MERDLSIVELARLAAAEYHDFVERELHDLRKLFSPTPQHISPTNSPSQESPAQGQ